MTAYDKVQADYAGACDRQLGRERLALEFGQPEEQEETKKLLEKHKLLWNEERKILELKSRLSLERGNHG